MRLLATLVTSASIVLGCGGCSRTYISAGDSGVPSPDGDTRLCLTAHGAYGHSYVDRTSKLLDVCIKRGNSTNETVLLSRSYRFVGSDLWAHVMWNSTNAATLYVYDWGDGVSSYDVRDKPRPSNYIATIAFYRDHQTGKFKEKR